MRRHDDVQGTQIKRGCIRNEDKERALFVQRRSKRSNGDRNKFRVQQLPYYIQCSSQTDTYASKMVKFEKEENIKEYYKPM